MEAAFFFMEAAVLRDWSFRVTRVLVDLLILLLVLLLAIAWFFEVLLALSISPRVLLLNLSCLATTLVTRALKPSSMFRLSFADVS